MSRILRSHVSITVSVLFDIYAISFVLFSLNMLNEEVFGDDYREAFLGVLGKGALINKSIYRIR